MRNTFKALAATLISAALIAPAFAEDASAPTWTIGYGDLSLSRTADVARLHRRLAAALETVCGSYDGAASWEQEAIARCRADATAALQPKLAALVAAEQATRVAAR